jgi:hypothetical protein
MQSLKVTIFQIKLWLHDKLCSIMGLNNVYRITLKDAALEIAKLRADVARLDRNTSLDVRSQLELVDFNRLGDIVWIKVADERMLRYDTFNHIRDYLRGHGKDKAILLLTKNDVQLASLTDADLESAGLMRTPLHGR